MRRDIFDIIENAPVKPERNTSVSGITFFRSKTSLSSRSSFNNFFLFVRYSSGQESVIWSDGTNFYSISGYDMNLSAEEWFTLAEELL
jgi:hypothetical protein